MHDISMEREFIDWLSSLQSAKEDLIVKEEDLSSICSMLPVDLSLSMDHALRSFLETEASTPKTRSKYRQRFWKIRKTTMLVGFSILLTLCTYCHKLPSNFSISALLGWLTDMLGMNTLALTSLFLTLSEEQYLRLDEIEEALHHSVPAIGIQEQRLFHHVRLHHPEISPSEFTHALNRLIDEHFFNVAFNEKGERLISLNLHWNLA